MSRARTLLARLKQDNLDFHYDPAGDDSPRGVIRLAASAVEQDPNDSMALMDLAFLQLRYGDYQRARANAERAYANNRHCPKILSRAGTVLFFLGDKRGLDLVNRALETESEDRKSTRLNSSH